MKATCYLDLAYLMRLHNVTIKQLSERMRVTQQRVREVRATKSVCYMTYCDYTQGVTGDNVFSMARYEAEKARTGGRIEASRLSRQS